MHGACAWQELGTLSVCKHERHGATHVWGQQIALPNVCCSRRRRCPETCVRLSQAQVLAAQIRMMINGAAQGQGELGREARQQCTVIYTGVHLACCDCMRGTTVTNETIFTISSMYPRSPTTVHTGLSPAPGVLLVSSVCSQARRHTPLEDCKYIRSCSEASLQYLAMQGMQGGGAAVRPNVRRRTHINMPAGHVRYGYST